MKQLKWKQIFEKWIHNAQSIKKSTYLYQALLHFYFLLKTAIFIWNDDDRHILYGAEEFFVDIFYANFLLCKIIECKRNIIFGPFKIYWKQKSISFSILKDVRTSKIIFISKEY